MAVDTRAHDIFVDIRRDATPLDNLSINSGSFNPGVTAEAYQTAGKSTSTVVQTVGDASLALDLNPRTPAYIALMNIMRAKADRSHPEHATYRDTVIDATFIVDNESDGRSRVIMSNCGVTDGTTSFQSGTTRVTQGLTLIAGTWRYRT